MGGIVWLLLLLVPESSPHTHSGQGFDLLFSNNLDTYEATPIFFEQPTPPWSKGSVIRNGFGQFSMGDRNVTHSFDAFAKLTKISLNASRVGLFTHRFIETSYYKDSVHTDTIAPYMLFQSPKPNYDLFERMAALWNGADNTNVNVFRFPNSSNYFTNSDFWPTYGIEGKTLKTLGKTEAPLPKGLDWSAHFPLPSTSHPVQEHNANSYISFVSVMNPIAWPPSSINVIRIKSEQNRELIASIPVKDVPYMHAFGLSRNYAIIFANPAFINIKQVIMTGNAAASIVWKPELGTDIYTVNIHTGKVDKFHTPRAEANLHFINAWERKNRIYVDYVNYKDMSVVKSMEIATLKNETLRNQMTGAPHLVRYKLNLRSGTVKRRHLGTNKPRKGYPASHFDFPVINPNFRFHQYCYIYGVAFRSDRKNLANTSLVKKDLCKKGRDRVVNIPDHYFQEPQFVPRPNSVSEDDGILIVTATDGLMKRSYVAIYDAQTMDQINRAWFPTVIPFSLHGHFFPGQA